MKADEDGNFTVEGPEAEGDYDYSATAIVDEQKSEAAEFQVTVEKEETETPAPAEREINVDPKEIVASDFVKEDKGVTVSVKGFDEGEKVTLEAASGPENVEGITLDETANENGAAAFSIYGTSEADPAVYLGKYDVKVTGANDTEDEKALAARSTLSKTKKATAAAETTAAMTVTTATMTMMAMVTVETADLICLAPVLN